MDGSSATGKPVEEPQAAMIEISQEMRMLEGMLFAAPEPVPEASLAERLPEGTDVAALLRDLAALYTGHGVNLVQVAGKWAFRTAPDLADSLKIEINVARKLSRAAVETLAIIAYHQPVTRGEIEEIRGVALSKGTLDLLLEIGWIRPIGRRRTPGRPVTWGTSPAFLDHFNLNSVSDLPGVEELKAAGLLDTRPVRTIFGEVSVLKPDAADDGDDAEDDGDAAPLDEEESPEFEQDDRPRERYVG